MPSVGRPAVAVTDIRVPVVRAFASVLERAVFIVVPVVSVGCTSCSTLFSPALSSWSSCPLPCPVLLFEQFLASPMQLFSDKVILRH
jgi:hypothetical protein